jgi:hypothetical protein
VSHTLLRAYQTGRPLSAHGVAMEDQTPRRPLRVLTHVVVSAALGSIRTGERELAGQLLDSVA